MELPKEKPPTKTTKLKMKSKNGDKTKTSKTSNGKTKKTKNSVVNKVADGEKKNVTTKKLAKN